MTKVTTIGPDIAKRIFRGHGICEVMATDKTISGSKGSLVGYVQYFD